MKTRIDLRALGLIFMVTCPLYALPAFPGAEGWGADTKGGRGGKVYMVTNLNSSGPGSLLQGILMREPRIIIFHVSGVLNLGVDPGMLDSLNSYLTIAGQTSPGGITIQNGGGYSWRSYGVDFHDFIWRYLRLRTQNGDDGIQFGPSHHFVMDHCDFSGGEDETTDFYYCYYFTVQWSVIANSERANSKGTIIAGRGDHITFHHTIWAHHMERAPAFFWDNVPPDNGLIDLRNNVIYDIDDYSTIFAGNDWPLSGEGRANIVGNIWKEGPNMGGTDVAYGPYFYHTVKVFDQDNCFYLKDGSSHGCDKLVKRYGAGNRVTTAWATPVVTTTSSAQAYEEVVGAAGTLPKDSMSRRIEKDIRTGTGADMIVNDPLITSGPQPPADADMDGMPDFWEEGMGLNKNDSSDAVKDKDDDGYTNIEEYINDLADARACRGYQNPVYPVPSDWPDYNPSCCGQVAVKKQRPDATAPVKRTIMNTGYDIYDIRGRRVGASDRVPPKTAGVYLITTGTGAHRSIMKSSNFQSEETR